MVVDRKERRKRTADKAEEILKEYDELALINLTYLIDKEVRFQLNSSQVALFIRNHPRIKQVGKRNESVYSIK
tara:strand:+ start:326 stop:544 length:219 start_codon:yes stop_codon:yes gene_type:complete